MPAARSAVAGTWVAAVAGTVAAVLAAPRADVFVWLAVVLACAVVVAIVVQLAAGEQRGFVVRLAAASVGALAAVAIGALAAAARALG